LEVPSLHEVAQRVADLVQPSEPEGWFEKVKSSAGQTALRRLPPKHVKTGACQQVVRLGSDVDLGEIPVFRADPHESGPTITAGQLVLADAETGHQHVGRYDLRVLDRSRLAACWYPHEEPALLWAGYRERNARMPVAVVLGGDPAGLLAAMAPLPPEADALALAGLLRQRPIELVPCRTIDLEVPTDAEIVLEGYIDPQEPPADVGLVLGPNGFLRPGPPAPLVHVTAWTHRSNPVYPAMVRGRPPQEETVIERALQRIMLPLVRAARHWAFVSICKHYAGQARRVASALWGLRQWMFAKFLVIVDEEVPVADAAAVWSAVAANADPGRDVFSQQGPPDPWDPAGPPGQLGHRLGIDATRKLPGEAAAEPSRPARMSGEVRRLVTQRWSEYELGGPSP
jgi:4-hydroxy-3-polyprenylbenzoate decarboxylase